ncbi:MAG: hypothetical protein ACE5H7_10575 [Acidiferrobacterales bacterium]
MEHNAGSSASERSERLHVQSREEARKLAGNLLERARRKILVFAPTLYGDFFNTAHAGGTLASFAAAHRNNIAHFLVEDVDHSLHHNSRVVELCRRFTDFIRMRRLNQDDTGLQEMFLVVDDTAYLHQPHVDKHDYRVAFSFPREARQLALRHERMWERSLVIPDILPLGL